MKIQQKNFCCNFAGKTISVFVPNAGPADCTHCRAEDGAAPAAPIRFTTSASASSTTAASPPSSGYA